MEDFEPKVKTKILTKDFIARYAYIFVLAILLVGGISYGYTFFTENRKIASGSITTANLTINFGNREINATGLSVPTTDQEGLSEYSKSLTITNTTAVDGKFTLTLTRTSGIELNNLRYALIVNGAIQEINDVPTSGEILSSAIRGNETTNVEVRLWPKTTYAGTETTFVGELEAEISYLGQTAASLPSPTGKYVNFNGNEVWQIVKIEDGRLVLTRQADYSGATSRTNSNRYNSSLTFNDNSMITSVSTDNKNAYLAKTVKIYGGSGTLADPYTLINNDFREEDKKVIAVITYKEDTTTVGTQNIYYNETNYISQIIDNDDFEGWSDGTDDYVLGDTIAFITDTNLTAKMVPKLSTKIMAKCNDSAITYVEKYNTANGAPIDTPDGSGDKDVCYYTTTSSSRNSDAEQNSNVIFGDFCWQIVRTTANGGVKLIYNGPKTNDDKCTSDADSNYSSNPRPSSIGVVGTNGDHYTTISGNKLYGTSFEIFDDNGTNKFRLKNTFTANWNGDYDNDGDIDYPKIIGNYVCGTSSSPTGTDSTCTTLYYVGHYQDATQASTEKYTIGTNTHYSQIGISAYNTSQTSPALVGYMYNDVYTNSNIIIPTESYDMITRTSSPGAYYYGDTATWVTDHYELTIGGVTPTTTSTWSSIRSTAGGMYTCRSTSDTSCNTVYYIVANSSNSYMYSVPLSNNEQATKSVTWTIGTGYSGSNGNYSLTGTSTLTITLKDWYTNYYNSSYKDFYICDNMTSGTCTSEVYYVGKTSNYQITYNKSSNTYTFANDVEYVNGEYKLILSDPTNKPYQSGFEWYKIYNSIDNTHYTCFENYDEVNNTCGGSIYYIFYTEVLTPFYIKLSNNEKVEDALQKMLNTSNSSSSTINKYNSAIKGVIDSWYESNLTSLAGYLDNNAVYCNDRTITSLGGWSPTGSTTTNYDLKLKNYSTPSKTTATLSCTNVTDRFSKNNTKAKLSYPIGLLSESERAMMFKGFAKTSRYWWLGSPRGFSEHAAIVSFVSTTGEFIHNDLDVHNYSGVRPAIVLKPGVLIDGGDGTYNSPYIIDTTGS